MEQWVIMFHATEFVKAVQDGSGAITYWAFLLGLALPLLFTYEQLFWPVLGGLCWCPSPSSHCASLRGTTYELFKNNDRSSVFVFSTANLKRLLKAIKLSDVFENWLITHEAPVICLSLHCLQCDGQLNEYRTLTFGYIACRDPLWLSACASIGKGRWSQDMEPVMLTFMGMFQAM